jgi:hypothetical protein
MDAYDAGDVESTHVVPVRPSRHSPVLQPHTLEPTPASKS